MMDYIAKCMAFSPYTHYCAYGCGNGGMKSHGDYLEGGFGDRGFTVPQGDGTNLKRRG